MADKECTSCEKASCDSCKKKVGNYSSPRISSEFMDCALPLTFDSYNLCSFKCQYCFGEMFKACNPAYKDGITLKHVNVKKINDTFNGKRPNDPYYRNFLKHRFVFHWGGLTEPFCYFERKQRIGLEIMNNLADIKYPTLFSTKGLSLFLDDKEYMDLFKRASEAKNFAFQFSIVANTDEVSSKIEPHTPVTSERLRAMKAMSDLGYWTVLRLRPFIIGITDVGLEELLIKAKECGARAISTEFFALDSRIIPLLGDRIKTISDLVGYDIIAYAKKLSPSERGGYMRLNRDVKEHFVKRLYVKCRELGLQIGISDPDFKELGDSACCCSLPSSPDVYPENPELCNYSKGQLTGELINLRKRYWKSGGKDCYLHWEDVDSKVANKWSSDAAYCGDSIRRWNTNYSIQDEAHQAEFKVVWNKLRSPSGPYRYFHGMIKPHHLDANDMIVYKYNPKPYELRWRREGLL